MTTGKPDDIREQAKRIYFERCDEVNRLAARFEEEEVIDLLARAILAAKAEEREACAALCGGLRHDDRNSESEDWVAATFACQSAIRKRGEG